MYFAKWAEYKWNIWESVNILAEALDHYYGQKYAYTKIIKIT